MKEDDLLSIKYLVNASSSIDMNNVNGTLKEVSNRVFLSNTAFNIIDMLSNPIPGYDFKNSHKEIKYMDKLCYEKIIEKFDEKKLSADKQKIRSLFHRNDVTGMICLFIHKL